MIRLLNIRTKEFKEFYDLESVPPYAILSHRWIHAQRNGKHRALELSHTEFLAGTGDDRGYAKIDKACEAVRDLSQKLELDLQWIWIDSCCIDKTNNEEYSEAINSMYEWYARSYVCIAYLDDADPFDEASPSEWFSRGWTLQELIAPERVLFYNKDWIGCGSRNDYSPGVYGGHSFHDRSVEIAAITHIDATLLTLTKRKYIKRRLDSIPACQKMSWASGRKTTKDEDTAYCLIGIFDIPHMYLKRGEGRRAFIRLQEEIIKQSNDLTLFAWKLSGDTNDACMEDNRLTLEDLRQAAPEDAPFFDSSPRSDLHGVFACGPCHFRHASQIEPTQLAVYNDEATVTSRGVKLTTPLLGSGPFLPFKMPLYCTDEGSAQLLSIELRLLGGSIYARTNCTQLPQLHKDAKVIPNQDDVFLAHNVHRFQDCAGQMHKHAIRLPKSIQGGLQRAHVSPGYLWSSKHNLVITNGCRFFVGYANYEDGGYHANQARGEPKTVVTLLFGLDHLQRPWFCLSNADSSFEPHSLEGRKLYLERVWRPASQHTRTAYLDDEKPFSVAFSNSFNPRVLQGSMRAAVRQFCDRDIYEVEFLDGQRPIHAGQADVAADAASDRFIPSPDRPRVDHSFSPVGISANYTDFFTSHKSPSLFGHDDLLDSFDFDKFLAEPHEYIDHNLFFPPSSADSGPSAVEFTGVAQQSIQPQAAPGGHNSPWMTQLASTGSPYTSIGLTPQVRPHPGVAGVKTFHGPDPTAHLYHPMAAPLQSGNYPANHALQDYQMQLMLLEQQNKKRLLRARQEQDQTSIESLLRQQVAQGLPAITEAREETTPVSTSERGSNQEAQDQPMQDVGTTQNGAGSAVVEE